MDDMNSQDMENKDVSIHQQPFSKWTTTALSTFSTGSEIYSLLTTISNQEFHSLIPQ